MRRLIWILLTVSVAVGLALLMRFNHGNLALLWPPYRVDVSINLALLVLVVGFALLHLLLIAFSNALNLPARVRGYRERRARETATAGLRDGLLALFEGRFGRAERLAQGALGDRSLAGPAMLVAARAAHRMREAERRDRWLESAAAEPGAEHAKLVTEAEMAVDDRRPLDAIAAIEKLHRNGPRHIQSLRVALRAYEQAERWSDLLHTLRQLEKRDALHPAAVRGLKTRACRALFAAKADDAQEVHKLYASLTPAEREIEEVAEASALAFLAAGRGDQGAAIVEAALERAFDERLARLYPRFESVPVRDRLRRAEAWRARYGDEPALLLTLGELCAQEGLWGKAEGFLAAAAQARPGREAWLLLGWLEDRLGRPEEAARFFRLAALDGAAAPAWSAPAGEPPAAEPVFGPPDVEA